MVEVGRQKSLISCEIKTSTKSHQRECRPQQTATDFSQLTKGNVKKRVIKSDVPFFLDKTEGGRETLRIRF